MWEFNYGEWTEAYVFLRLLSNGRVYAADRNFERDENVYIDILNIIRYEKEHILEFQRELESVTASDNGVVFKVLTYSELVDKADYLYNAVKNIVSRDRKFSVPEIEDYLTELRFSQPKVPKLPKDIEAAYGKKTDIIITLQDSSDRAVSTTGFSIKSHLGSSSSLFNSAMASNFLYEIIGCDEKEMYEINGKYISSEIGNSNKIHPGSPISSWLTISGGVRNAAATKRTTTITGRLARRNSTLTRRKRMARSSAAGNSKTSANPAASNPVRRKKEARPMTGFNPSPAKDPENCMTIGTTAHKLNAAPLTIKSRLTKINQKTQRRSCRYSPGATNLLIL